MDEIIKKFLAMSSTTRLFNELQPYQKTQLYKLADYYGKLKLYVEFLNERMVLYDFLKEIDVDRKNRLIPKEVIVVKKAENYHKERELKYKKIEDIKYIYKYQKVLETYVQSVSMSRAVKIKINLELYRIHEYIVTNKDLEI